MSQFRALCIKLEITFKRLIKKNPGPLQHGQKVVEKFKRFSFSSS